MSAELQNRAAQAVEMARGTGADEAWATATQSRDVEFNFRDGSLEKVKDTTSRGLNIQVYADGRYSSHETTDLNPDRLKSFVAEAVAITRALEPDKFREITPATLFANRPGDDLDLVDAAVAALTREQRLEWCQALDRVATDHDKVISATAGVYDGSFELASISSNGFSGTRASTYCWYGSSVTLRDQGERRAADGYYAGSAHVGDLPPASDRPGALAARVRKGADREDDVGRGFTRGRSADWSTAWCSIGQACTAGPVVLGRPGRDEGIQRQADHRRRPADSARFRVASFR